MDTFRLGLPKAATWGSQWNKRKNNLKGSQKLTAVTSVLGFHLLTWDGEKTREFSLQSETQSGCLYLLFPVILSSRHIVIITLRRSISNIVGKTILDNNSNWGHFSIIFYIFFHRAKTQIPAWKSELLLLLLKTTLDRKSETWRNNGINWSLLVDGSKFPVKGEDLELTVLSNLTACFIWKKLHFFRWKYGNKTTDFHQHNFRPSTKFLINICKQLNENFVLSLVFKDFPYTSIRPLKSTIHGIIDLPGLRSKELNPK